LDQEGLGDPGAAAVEDRKLHEEGLAVDLGGCFGSGLGACRRVTGP
jgi:hypothetical protein